MPTAHFVVRNFIIKRRDNMDRKEAKPDGELRANIYLSFYHKSFKSQKR